ncbi:hypothetical protein AB0D42_37795 [Streptomyces sp. NPDC048304]|uniref:hypothetical protein n=1 Tax=Streptomyces sp. NPDC048304 TaxID=3154820 RepID=UPI0033F28D26
MKKFMRRTATAGISAVLVGGALLAAGGSATAATPQADQGTKVADVRAVSIHVGNRDRDGERYESGSECQHLREYVSRNDGYGHAGERRGAHNRPDPWVAGQLAMFDPWITDQLAIFLPFGNPVQ